MPTQFLRVWLKGRSGRPITLRLTSETPQFVSGYEVNDDGDEVQPAGFERRLHLIQKSEIRQSQPMGLDNVYAQLIYTGSRTKGVGVAVYV